MQHEYLVLIHGLPHTFLLTEEQATSRGLSDSDRVQSPPVTKQAKPANKARAASTKGK